MSLLLLVVVQGWEGYGMNVGDSRLPLCVLLILIGAWNTSAAVWILRLINSIHSAACSDSTVIFHKLFSLMLTTLFLHTAFCLCVLLFLALSSKRPPNSVMQIVLMIGAFCMSIAWLNLEANEIVSVLQALGLLFNINTGERFLVVLTHIQSWWKLAWKHTHPSVQIIPLWGQILVWHCQRLLLCVTCSLNDPIEHRIIVESMQSGKTV